MNGASVKATLRSTLDSVLANSPAQALCRQRSADALTVLGYHDVPDRAEFGRQLDYLTAHFNPISIVDLYDCLDGARKWPQAPALVTFDDGARSVLENAAPELHRRGVPAVVFVIAGLLDGHGCPWWQEVEALIDAGGRTTRFEFETATEAVRRLKQLPDEERLATLAELRESADEPPPPTPQLASSELAALENAGVAVGNHTTTHPCLPRCRADKTTAEIVGAHEALEAILGHPPASFAYPNGDYDARAEPTLRELGYRAAFVFDHRPSPLPPPEPLRISRVRVNADDRLARFRIVVSGLHPRLHRLLGRN